MLTADAAIPARSPEDSLASPAPTEHAIADAILSAIAYSDVFDYPLTAEEIHRYLVKIPASIGAVCAALSSDRLVPARLARVDEYYTLPGREAIVETRRRRARAAADLWPAALRWGSVIASLPFVRMVAVTGALSVDNSEPGDDLDYLIVTEPGRLWMCRAFVIAVVHLAARRGDAVCPNYLISERALEVKERDLYTAREMAQMVPLAGYMIYERMRLLNPWVAEFLPNAGGPPRVIPPRRAKPSHLCRGAEAVLRTPPGAWLERWEMRRKLRKLSQKNAVSANPAESDFGPDWCKGHFEGHGRDTISAVNSRLKDVEA
jgi:hypothetical protein